MRLPSKARKALILVCLLVPTIQAKAQFNIDRLIVMGQSALYYEDYVLSIQYFNQAIAAKPYLYEPWFYRGVAKFYLEDYKGAESDCTEGIKINPYVKSLYEVRALCRINQKEYDGAIADYTTALREDPDNQQYWHNRTLCRINKEDYDGALADLDTINSRWSKYAPGFSMRAEVLLHKGDTAKAEESLDHALEIDPYDGSNWMVKAAMAMTKADKEDEKSAKKAGWKEAEQCLDKAIHLLPRVVNNYINRALCRYKQNNLRGTMADYDMALDLDPNNFIAHYNRGLLRAQVGDDNRAIEDFDFVLRLEPDELMALFNRALLRDRTGDLRGAIADYSKVIEMFPNFWTGLHYRAQCYRRLGDSRRAELDEFRILKAQMDKRQGKQQRMTKRQREMRRKSDKDMEKYNQLVVADEQEKTASQYKNDYRGRVQDREANLAFMPMFEFSFERKLSEVHNALVFDVELDRLNKQQPQHPIYITAATVQLTKEQTDRYFALSDSLDGFSKAVLSAMLQDYSAAIQTATQCISKSPTALAYWHRAVCREKQSAVEKNAISVPNNHISITPVIDDFNAALALNPQSACLLYNRGCAYAANQDYSHAISDFTAALKIDSRLAEAYYNRGLAQLQQKNREAALSDLGKAGELGLYSAYSIIKKLKSEK